MSLVGSYLTDADCALFIFDLNSTHKIIRSRQSIEDVAMDPTVYVGQS